MVHFPTDTGSGQEQLGPLLCNQGHRRARAFISHPYLGGNLREISEALLQLDSNDPVAVMGWPDDLKLRSCMTLFANACEDNEVFLKVLDKYYGGLQDSETLNILRSQAEGAER